MMKTQVTTENLVLSLRLRALVEKKMRSIRRFARDVVSTQISLRRILVRKPYQIGDRIQIGQVSGDVVDVSYFDTTLLELGGSFLSTGHPSGRVVKFPNSKVLEEPIYNYIV